MFTPKKIRPAAHKYLQYACADDRPTDGRTDGRRHTLRPSHLISSQEHTLYLSSKGLALAFRHSCNVKRMLQYARHTGCLSEP